jgi:hypothetical protein
VLDALARRLATAGLAELAARTSRLAWSREEPTAEAIDALAAGARRAAARSDGP